MKDFSRARTKKTFRIDEDVFEAAPALPADLLVNFAARFANVANTPPGEQVGVLRQALEMILLPESFERLSIRTRDKTNPIDLDQLSEVVTWLLGEYGLRPTDRLPNSSDGQPIPESGTNSAAVFLPGESVSKFSPSPVS